MISMPIISRLLTFFEENKIIIAKIDASIIEKSEYKKRIKELCRNPSPKKWLKFVYVKARQAQLAGNISQTEMNSLRVKLAEFVEFMKESEVNSEVNSEVSKT